MMQNFENTGSVQKCAQNAESNVLKDIHGYAQRSKALGRHIKSVNEIKELKCFLFNLYVKFILYLC